MMDVMQIKEKVKDFIALELIRLIPTHRNYDFHDAISISICMAIINDTRFSFRIENGER